MAFSYSISDMPDLDQRWNSLPGHGANHCVPAATMNLMYYYRGKGFGNAVKYEPSQHSDHRPRNINALGEYMCTDADSGTNASDAFDGLLDWLGDRGLFALVSDRRARDNENVTYAGIRNMLKSGGHVVVSMGRYHFDDGEFERDSSHAMTLASLVRTDDGKITIGVRDPNDDNHRSTQSETRLKQAELDEQTRNIEGDTVKVLRWQTSTNPYRFIDGWLAIQPIFLMTNLTGGFLTNYQADIATGAITTSRIALPFRGEVADLAIDVPNYSAAVIDRNTGDVWRLDIAEGAWTKLAGASGARHITFGGRHRRLFVARDNAVHAFAEDGRPVAHLTAEQSIDALSYDQRNDRLIVGAAAGTRLFAVDTRMQVISSVAITPPAGSGRLALSVNSADSTIAISRAGNRNGSTLRWEGGAATAASPIALATHGTTSAVQVDRVDRMYANDNGHIASFDGAGNKTSRKSPFDGLAAGPLMKVARSVSILDEARSKLPAWRLGYSGRR